MERKEFSLGLSRKLYNTGVLQSDLLVLTTELSAMGNGNIGLNNPKRL